MTTDAGGLASAVSCHGCGAPVLLRDAYAITVDADGTLARWTRGRGAFYAAHTSHTPPTVYYLCAACYHDRFESAAQADTERDQRADHGDDARE